MKIQTFCQARISNQFLSTANPCGINDERSKYLQSIFWMEWIWRFLRLFAPSAVYSRTKTVQIYLFKERYKLEIKSSLVG